MGLQHEDEDQNENYELYLVVKLKMGFMGVNRCIYWGLQ